MSSKLQKEDKTSHPPSLKVQMLLSILLCDNAHDRGKVSNDPDEPLIVSEAMIKRMEEDRNLLQRLQGWKWETLWTTKAVLYLMKHCKEESK